VSIWTGSSTLCSSKVEQTKMLCFTVVLMLEILPQVQQYLRAIPEELSQHENDVEEESNPLLLK
jgi:hypothetical protein